MRRTCTAFRPPRITVGLRFSVRARPWGGPSGGGEWKLALHRVEEGLEEVEVGDEAQGERTR